MPRQDRTGPQGRGAKTGRGQGKCNPLGSVPASPQQGGRGTDRCTGQQAGRGSGRKGWRKGGRQGR